MAMQRTEAARDGQTGRLKIAQPKSEEARWLSNARGFRIQKGNFELGRF